MQRVLNQVMSAVGEGKGYAIGEVRWVYDLQSEERMEVREIGFKAQLGDWVLRSLETC